MAHDMSGNDLEAVRKALDDPKLLPATRKTTLDR
jgi:hypothetical protein